MSFKEKGGEKAIKSAKVFCMLFISVIILFSVSCGKKEQYNPVFTLADGYTLSGETISGTVYGETAMMTYDILTSRDSVIVFSDSTREQYVENGAIPLEEGINSFILCLSNGREEREYYLEIELVLLEDFEIRVMEPERTYHIGERFDRSSVEIIARTSQGEVVIIDRYQAEYEFSSLGKHTVGIEIGGLYHSFQVKVTEEYVPVLDEAFSADGVQYLLSDGTAVLLSADTITGFFAVPASVISNGVSYSVTEVAAGAFENNTGLTGIQIPDGLRIIGDSAFSGCTSLEWVEMPDTLDTLGRFAFADCSSLFAFSVPTGPTEIPTGAFSGCTSLMRITLPDTFEAVGDFAFSGCESLLSVSMPDTLRSIGSGAFENCFSLERMVIGCLDFIGDRAFSNCQALSAFACADISEIGEDVFADSPDVVLYTGMQSGLLEFGKSYGIPTETVEDVPLFIALPETFAIGSEFPYRELCAVRIEEGRMVQIDDYTVEYDTEACGYLPVIFTAGNLSDVFTVFVSYEEPILLDTDTRGAVYALYSQDMTATLVSLPEYVRESDVFNPKTEGVFLVPTTLLRDDGIYTVTGAFDDVLEGCQNISKLIFPKNEQD